MPPVSLRNNSIVPYQEATFRDVLRHRLRDYAITMEDDKLTINEGASEEEIEDVFRHLFDVNNQCSVSIRFAIGDLYNAIPNKYGAKKEFVTRRFGEKFYKIVRQFAWIASKWPEGTRDLSKGWTHYVENSYNAPHKTKAPVPLSFLSQEFLPDGAVVIHYEGPHRRRYTARVEAQAAVLEA